MPLDRFEIRLLVHPNLKRFALLILDDITCNTTQETFSSRRIFEVIVQLGGIRGNPDRRKMGIGMTLDDYKVLLYRNQPFGWVAEIPSIPGCYALMPTRTEALSELEEVYAMIEAEHREKGLSMPTDTTEIVHA